MLAPSLAVIVAILVATLGSGSARADDWGTPGLDSGHARFSAEQSGARFADGRWTAAFPGAARVLASPVVADGFVVVVDLGGFVQALRADNGQVVWQAPAGSAVHGTPAVTNGRVFIPTFGNKLLVLRLQDGAPQWTRDLGGTILSSPTPVSGDVVVAAGFPQRHLVRLAGATGEIVWQSPEVLEQFSNTSPAIGGGLAVVGSNGGRIYAFDLATGALRWEYIGDGIVHLAAPLIAGGRVYVAGGNDSDHVHAVDAATGAAVPGWPISLPTPDPDISGALVGRRRAISSFSAAGGVLTLETRLDDALDTDSDGGADTYLSRESVLGLDAATGAVLWQQPLARAVFADPNDVPKFFICPTPAAFNMNAAPLLAAASSLTAKVSILDMANGNDDGEATVAGRALASPVMVNGRLVTVSESGVVEGQLSSVNHPPSAPILAANPYPMDRADVILRWLPAVDPDAELPIYELRLDSDGEVLESYQQRLLTAPGATSIEVVVPLSADVTYTFAVRARDPHGALSPWSAPESFTVVASGSVAVDGMPATNLRAAVAGAQAGSLITLGAGIFPLSEPLHVGPGVTIGGAGAGRTTLDGAGLAVGVNFDGGDANHSTGLDKVTVTGAQTCVAVNGGVTGIQLTHLVVRDCPTVGVAVRATGGASIANVTLVGNGAGVESAGGATIKNSLLAQNAAGLKNDAAGTLASTYNDLFGNLTDYQGALAGTGDFSTAITFVDLPGRNLRISHPEASTDKGDPSDDVGAEPAPNGARINLGAFGGTADAELSKRSTAIIYPGTPTQPTPLSPQILADRAVAGCSLAGSAVPDHASLIFALALLGLGSRRRSFRASRARSRTPSSVMPLASPTRSSFTGAVSDLRPRGGRLTRSRIEHDDEAELREAGGGSGGSAATGDDRPQRRPTRLLI